jgi:hypothetical protein
VTGRGRPAPGVKVQVRIPEHLLDAVDVGAEDAGISRAAMIREVLRDWARTPIVPPSAPQPRRPSVD